MRPIHDGRVADAHVRRHVLPSIDSEATLVADSETIISYLGSRVRTVEQEQLALQSGIAIESSAAVSSSAVFSCGFNGGDSSSVWPPVCFRKRYGSRPLQEARKAMRVFYYKHHGTLVFLERVICVERHLTWSYAYYRALPRPPRSSSDLLTSRPEFTPAWRPGAGLLEPRSRSGAILRAQRWKASCLRSRAARTPGGGGGDGGDPSPRKRHEQVGTVDEGKKWNRSEAAEEALRVLLCAFSDRRCQALVVSVRWRAMTSEGRAVKAKAEKASGAPLVQGRWRGKWRCWRWRCGDAPPTTVDQPTSHGGVVPSNVGGGVPNWAAAASVASVVEIDASGSAEYTPHPRPRRLPLSRASAVRSASCTVAARR